VALAPESAWCIYNRGLALLKAGRAEQAIKDFDRALAIDPQFGIAYVGRATAHQEAGHAAEAEADLHKAAELGIAK
jgi:Tfp pilus assembly protein PilF